MVSYGDVKSKLAFVESQLSVYRERIAVLEGQREVLLDLIKDDE